MYTLLDKEIGKIKEDGKLDFPTKIKRLEDLKQQANCSVDQAIEDLHDEMMYCPRCDKYYLPKSFLGSLKRKMYSIKVSDGGGLDRDEWEDRPMDVYTITCPAGHVYLPDTGYEGYPNELILGKKWFEYCGLITELDSSEKI